MVQDCMQRILSYEDNKDKTQEDDDLQQSVLVTLHTTPLCALPALMLWQACVNNNDTQVQACDDLMVLGARMTRMEPDG